MSDSFEYTLTSAGNADGIVGENGGVGFTGNWAVATTGTGAVGSSDIVPGLTFSTHQTSGNAVRVSAASGTGTATRFVSRTIATSAVPANGSELWVSYLYRRDVMTSTTNSVAIVRMDSNADPATSGTLAFRVSTKRGISPSLGAIGVDSSDSTGTGSSVQDGNVYLVVARFTNFNLGTTLTPQVGTYWILNQAGYDAARDAGDPGITAADLTANAVQTGTDSATNPQAFAGGWSVDLATVADTGGQTTTATFDEIRYATTIGEVLVPEPSSVGLLAVASVGLLRRRRSRHS